MSQTAPELPHDEQGDADIHDPVIGKSLEDVYDPPVGEIRANTAF